MTEPDPREQQHRGTGPRHALRKGIVPFAVVSGAVANGIQILSAGGPTTLGLIIAGATVVVGMVPLGIRLARMFRPPLPPGAQSIQLAEREQELTMVHARLRNSEDEWRNMTSAIEATFTDPPYTDEMTIVFTIGEKAGGDRVEEHHVTAASHAGAAVHWYAFEAFSRGREHALYWDEVKLRVTREPDIYHELQQAKAIRLTSIPTARALVVFAPPRGRVRWSARYDSPGLWDQLRQKFQKAEWIPPLARADEDGGRRSTVQSITFVFRVPRTLGELEVNDHPQCADFRFASQDAHSRSYTLVIRDTSELLDHTGSAPEPVRWRMLLNPEDAP